LLGFGSRASFFGQSLCSQEDNIALLYSGDTYKAVTNEFTIDFRPPDSWRMFARGDWQLSRELSDPRSLAASTVYKRLIKAKVQAFQNGLLDDKLVW
jgi:hypothetical protein